MNVAMIKEQLISNNRRTSKHCFLPRTMFWTSPSTAVDAAALKVGDRILGIFGEYLHVVHIELLQEAVHDIVELKTRAACLAVTADHRIVVPGIDGKPSAEKPASQLKRGDRVFCAQQAVDLVKVSKHSMNTRVVEIRFQP